MLSFSSLSKYCFEFVDFHISNIASYSFSCFRVNMHSNGDCSGYCDDYENCQLDLDNCGDYFEIAINQNSLGFSLQYDF